MGSMSGWTTSFSDLVLKSRNENPQAEYPMNARGFQLVPVYSRFAGSLKIRCKLY
jgi:hypothetical protein